MPIISETELTKLIQRFLDKVEFVDGHWLWTGTRTHGGHGLFAVNGRSSVTAHTFSVFMCYEISPTGGREFHHTCPYENCVHPDHVCLKTRQQHMLLHNRFHNDEGQRTCKHGHLWVEDNIYRRPNGTEMCRICHRQSVRDSRRRRASN